ncbi:YciK family oxidoreductase [Umboniibacter marinipuniceus]|uniref:NAD(P)-dependent dehydrogenase (Short-subunit alcohol dehydrogenase family) n=1 Tax=Umboniibacter marinipuniceus TaxID=569599 RepID=A0A3M0AFE4_9GAMM|nr:YciK family oxidoreductase [Umboniibacter marinipuniceus]RMA81195.1 NAD(P)-dependent dehydrogenase (short-subunit alcohol dehydrogenase family) [Umboniibacter marinipuniceus]
MTTPIPNYQASKDCLKDRVILITGAGDGIGKTLSITAAKHGATVLLLGRTTAKLANTYDEICALGAPEPAILAFDLSGASEDDYNTLAAAIETEYGRLDGLVHNASLLGRRSPIASYPADTWQRVMQVNVNAAFLLSKAMLPLLEIPAHSSMVFTSSSVGRTARAHWGAYGVSKFATEGLALTLADELDGISNVRCNTFNPGATRTAMRAGAYPAENPAAVKSAEELMPWYLYLLSDDSIGVSGEQLSY